MSDQSLLAQALIGAVPDDGSCIGNQMLLELLKERVSGVTEKQFWSARDELMAKGFLVKGQGAGELLRGESYCNRNEREHLDVAARADQVAPPLLWTETSPVIKYKKKRRAEIDGGQVVNSSDHPVPETNSWEDIVSRLLPVRLPTDRKCCSELLLGRLKNGLSEAVVEATAALVAYGEEEVARNLIVDLLQGAPDSERLRKLILMQMLFDERSRAAASAEKITINISSFTADQFEVNYTPNSAQDLIAKIPSSDWSWQPADETPHPEVDDQELRDVAERLQEAIGTHRAQELGAVIQYLDDVSAESLSFEAFASAALNEEQAAKEIKTPAQLDIIMLERIANLGAEALDVLRYLADNPGDKAIHIKQMFEWPIDVINTLLKGPLHHCISKDDAGGWSCNTWAACALDELDKKV